MTADPSLPPPNADQAYMLVSALEGGHLDLRAGLVLADAPETERHIVPSLAFLLTHSKTGTKIVFDLGLRRDIESYPPGVRQFIANETPVTVEQDVSESLIKGGINLDDVSYIILSHLHFDHTGDASWFPKSTFIVGGAARKLLEDLDPQNPQSQFLDSTSVPSDGRTRFLGDSDFSTSIGEFSRAHDLFGDGSLYIVDAPGHLEGHINALARTSSTGGWILLGGDSCHHLCLLDGDGKFFYRQNEKGEIIDCIHVDKDAAEVHLARVKTLRKMKDVLVLIAHDYEWYDANKGGASFLPGFISPKA